MNSKERRAWLKKHAETFPYKGIVDIIAKTALDEISELDSKIKALEKRVSELTYNYPGYPGDEL